MLVHNTITMEDVLAMDDFKDAQVLTGEIGLKNEVHWIHPLEIWDNPNEWIDGGELIFCCALGIDNPKEFIPFFRQLLKKGIAGFCLQLNKYMNEIPSEMLKLAVEYNCPFIVFKRVVRFIDLSRNLINTIVKYVNQSYLTEKQKLEENHWMLDWLNGNLEEEHICELLKISTFELQKFHFFTVIVEYSKSQITYQWSEGIYLSISRNLRILFDNNQFIFYPFFANGLLTGIVLDFGKNETWKIRFNNIVQGINQDLKIQEGKPHLILASGYRSNQISNIPRSYKTSMDTMGICQRFHADKYIYEDLNLYFILSLIEDVDNLDRMKDFIMDQIQPLLTFDIAHNGKLMSTLKEYYRCNCNKQLAAKNLDITRQSLYYRLEQIKEILGVDILNTEKKLTLEIAFAFYEYFLKMA
ncbi:MAG: PucR family transcriptional regulator ligand-binding domain-containing protein [Clostridiales bacterium]